jgi:4,5-dihydroxyphthalate decarboxylase
MSQALRTDSMSNPTTLRVAFGRYDRTQALLDGSVSIEGNNAIFETPPFETLFERAFDEQAYDVAELSFSNFLYLTSIGQCPYVGLPLFPSRMFRHSAIFIRTDRGIDKPASLAGKTIGVREYSMTAALCARGVLSDEYGVSASSVRWRYGRAEADDRPPVVRMSPRGVETQSIPADKNLSDMLASGEIDALVAYKPPSCFLQGAPNVARLFSDHEAAERTYYSKTRNFPIMHLIGIRRALAGDTGLVVAICDAFEKARRHALYALSSYQALTVSHPWAPVEAARLREFFGGDFWPYGISANRSAIDATARWSFDQGLANRQLTVEEMFAPTALD